MPIHHISSHFGMLSNILFQITVLIQVKGLENEIHIDSNELIKHDKILIELFNKHFINIVEKTFGLAPNCIGNPENT